MASERLPSRPACLLVASGAAEGVSAQSFLHCFTLASAAFNLQVATPGGKTMDFVDVNESNARWVQDFRLKAYASPAKLESIDEPICAVGHGVAALCCATSEDRSWVFQGYSVTGPASLTPCMWCWIATWSPGRTPAPPSLPCRTCSSSVAAGSEEAPGQAPSRCHHLQMSWVSPETLPRDTRPAWPLGELLGGSEDPP
ncbi:glutamine amidotransferase-like class 1 domain-containing protein 1 isoform X4 [Bos indicus]|uniref:Glutamine amidotransferase-like class 1 domain-containing protein 1 n=1 Tax=Bos indicus TaxID=9915 RepID=A0ABM4RTY7_BOSIN|nr:glutamine amidotransferase-like class 1 domain-containing protein 1 isoform X4 [Bos indicus x Bos taurus]